MSSTAFGYQEATLRGDMSSRDLSTPSAWRRGTSAIDSSGSARTPEPAHTALGGAGRSGPTDVVTVAVVRAATWRALAVFLRDLAAGERPGMQARPWRYPASHRTFSIHGLGIWPTRQ